MIDFLNKIAIRDKFICDECGEPDLLLGMYEKCFVCKNVLIRKALKSEDRFRLYSLDILYNFLTEFDDFGSKLSAQTQQSQKKLFSSGIAGSLFSMTRDHLLKEMFSGGKIGGERIGGIIKHENQQVTIVIDENYHGEHKGRAIILLAVSAALKHIIDFKPADKLQEWLYYGNDRGYQKRKNLEAYAELLCRELNSNQYYHQIRIGDKIVKSEYVVNEDNPEETIIGIITDNQAACEFLRNGNLIQNDICHFCGDYLFGVQYTFTEPISNLTVPICRDCYSSKNY